MQVYEAVSDEFPILGNLLGKRSADAEPTAGVDTDAQYGAYGICLWSLWISL